jgi:hypothetical protein
MINNEEVKKLEFWKNLKDQIDSSSIKGKTKLLLNPTVIGTGKTSYVYRIEDLERRLDMVCKIDINVVKGQYKLANECA